MEYSNQIESGMEFLIGKNNVDTFLKKYWERNIFVNRECPFQNIPFTLNDLENIFSHSHLTSGDLRLSSVDQNIEPLQYCDDKGVVNVQKVFFFFNRGSTIIIRSIEDFNPWLRKLCFNLKAELGNVKRIFINLYLTPENSQGFFHHYDTEDVFIFQVSGKKEWYLYDAPVKLPLEDQRFSMNATKPDKKYLKKILLKSEQTLYIPRGVIHEAKSQSDISCHLTISIVPFTWNDIIKEYQKELSHSNILLRTSLPTKMSDKVALSYLKKTNRLNVNIINKVLKQFKLNYDTQRLTQFNTAGMLSFRNISSTDASIVCLNSNLFRDVHYSDITLELEVGVIKILLPLKASSIVEHILKHKRCSINDIPTKYSRKDKLLIINRLINDSFITVVKNLN